jgi:hypothetical protein
MNTHANKRSNRKVVGALRPDVILNNSKLGDTKRGKTTRKPLVVLPR